MNKKTEKLILSMNRITADIMSVALVLLGIVAIFYLFMNKTEAVENTAEVGTIETGGYWVRGYEWGKYAFVLQDRMFELGYSANDTVIIINNCKKSTVNVGRCIRTASSIGYAESSGWNRCKNNNCMGLYAGDKAYKNKDLMFKDWIWRYNKWWYAHPNANDYYGPNPITGYCYGGCYNGLRNFQYAFKLLNK